MSEARRNILIGAVVGGVVALFLVYLGLRASRPAFTAVALLLTFAGAWVGWKSTAEAKSPFQTKRYALEDETLYHRQHAKRSAAAAEAQKAEHDLSRTAEQIERSDELADREHRRKRIEFEVAEGELRGRQDEQKTSRLRRILERVGLRRKIAAASSPELLEMEEAIQRAVQDVEDVVAFGTEKIREFQARTDIDDATRALWIKIVNREVAKEVKRRLDDVGD